MNSKLKARILAGASLAALAATGQAWAQDAQPAGGAEVEAVVVTVQKREQDAIEAPLALTAYTGDFLERTGIQQFDQLSLFVPGFEVQNQSPNNPSFVMRGITSDTGDSAAEPRVSVFQDGVSISKARGSFVELFDLERVEVAKGPQSTLFGRGALIGAVNIIQAKADPARHELSLGTEYGSYNYLMLDGAVNLPVAETFAVRLAGRIKDRDGYVTNLAGGEDFNSVHTKAARLALNWRPAPGVNADLLVNYQDDKPSGTSFKSGGFSPTAAATGVVLGALPAWKGAALSTVPGFEGGQALGLDRYVWGITGLLDIELSEAFSLSSISAYRRFQGEEVFDADGTSLPILTAAEDARGKQWSQELRLNWEASEAVFGFFGGSYFKEEAGRRVPTRFDERMALGQFTGQLNAAAAGSRLPATTPAPAAFFDNPAFVGALVQGAAASLSGNRLLIPAATAAAVAARMRPDFLEQAIDESDLTSYDLFADVTVKPVDRLELSGGVRYTSDDRTTRYASSVIGGRSVLGGVIGAAQTAAAGTPAAIATANQIIGGLAAFGSNPAAPLPLFALSAQPTANNGDFTGQDLDSSGWTWRLVGRYAFAPGLNGYASYSRGRRPEVLQAGPPTTPFGPVRFTVVDSETVDSFEAGLKTELLERRLRFDVSAYHYRYENFQTTLQQGTQFITANAGEAKASGVEAQAQLAATAGLDLFATYAYSHARFASGAFEGNRFRLSPDHSASLGASLRISGLGGTFELRPTASWQSSIFFDDDNDLPRFQQPPSAFVADNVQDEVQDGYGLVNLRVGYAPSDGPWRIELFANNLFDERYLKDAGNTGDSLGLPTFIAGEPLFYGVSISVRR
jgi:iron complex outermembrane receptor protein